MVQEDESLDQEMLDFSSTCKNQKKITSYFLAPKKKKAKKSLKERLEVKTKKVVVPVTKRAAEYTIFEKLQILANLETNNISVKTFAKNNKSFLDGSKIHHWKDRKTAYESVPEKRQKILKRVGGGRKPVFNLEMDISVLEEMFMNNFDGAKVTDDLIKRKGKEVVEKHNKKLKDGEKKISLEFSNGWVWNFKTRYGIGFRLNGKLRDCKNWKSVLLSLMWEYRSDIVKFVLEKMKGIVDPEGFVVWDESPWKVFEINNGTLTVRGMGDIKLKQIGDWKLRHTFIPIYNGVGILIGVYILFKASHIESKMEHRRAKQMRGIKEDILKKIAKKIFKREVEIVVGCSKSGFMNRLAVIHLLERIIVPYAQKRKEKGKYACEISDCYYSHRDSIVNSTEYGKKISNLRKNNNIVDVMIRPNTTAYCQVGDTMVNNQCKRAYKNFIERNSNAIKNAPAIKRKMMMIKLLLKSLSNEFVKEEQVKLECVRKGVTTPIGDDYKIDWDKGLRVGKNFGINLKSEKVKKSLETAFDNAKKKVMDRKKTDKEKIELKENVASICSFTKERFSNLCFKLSHFFINTCKEKKVNHVMFKYDELKEFLIDFFILYDVSNDVANEIVEDVTKQLKSNGILYNGISEDIFGLSTNHPLIALYINKITQKDMSSFWKNFNEKNNILEEDLEENELTLKEKPVKKPKFDKFHVEFTDNILGKREKTKNEVVATHNKSIKKKKTKKTKSSTIVLGDKKTLTNVFSSVMRLYCKDRKLKVNKKDWKYTIISYWNSLINGKSYEKITGKKAKSERGKERKKLFKEERKLLIEMKYTQEEVINIDEEVEKKEEIDEV